MPTRKPYLNRVVAALNSQCCDAGVEVPIRIRVCDPQLTLGENRNAMVRSSEAEYIAFFDDDDLPGTTYIRDILNAASTGVDYVGFKVQCYMDNTPLKPTTHSLRYTSWSEDADGYYRDISHINPILRSLAVEVPFEGGHGEDVRWADRMRATGKVRTEHYVDRVLYHYYFRSGKNRAMTCPECRSDSTVRLEEDSACNRCGVHFDRHEPRKSCLWD